MTAKTINVRLPEALYNQIEALAEASARTKGCSAQPFTVCDSAASGGLRRCIPSRSALHTHALRYAEHPKSFLAINALTHCVQTESWQLRDIQEDIKEADAGEFATDKQVNSVFAKYGA